jgi:hypothetical protein
MSSMTFSKIELDLHDNPRWRALAENYGARLTYFTIRTSARLNYSGCFYCPIDALSFESMIPRQELRKFIDLLQEHNLIEFDQASEWVRIVGWYHGVYAQENAAKVLSWSRNYLESRLPRCQLLTNSAAEFIVGSLTRAGNFRQESDHAEKIYCVLDGFTRSASRFYNGLPKALELELRENGHSSWRHLRGRGEELLRLAKIEACSSSQENNWQGADTLLAPCHEPVGRVRPHKDKEEEKEKKAGEFRESSARPLPATLQSKLAISAMSQ